MKEKLRGIIAQAGVREALLLAFFSRLIFKLFLAKIFYSSEQYFLGNDTHAWAAAFQNLLETGSFTIDPNAPNGFFARMPFFSYYLGMFYLLAGRDWILAYKILSWFQLFLDCGAVWLLYQTVKQATGNTQKAFITSVLLALYPFYIVWSPVAYSESLSIFMLLASLYFFTRPGNKRVHLVLSGLLLGWDVLNRPQLFLMLAAVLAALFVLKQKQLRQLMQTAVFFCLGFGLAYGPWPARNLLLHQRVLLTQDFSGIGNWDQDVLDFASFIYSVQTDWYPQFEEILANKPVTYPANAHFSDSDSLQLVRAFEMCRECSFGFSNWVGFWKPALPKRTACSDSISATFRHLRKVQMQEHPFDFWVKVPLGNLNKALFKTALRDSSGESRKLASLLFYLRTLLILMGLAGIVVMGRKSDGMTRFLCLSALFYFAMLYPALCAGTGTLFRNIEMRYFLHADVLLLIPAGLWISNILGSKEMAAIRS